jgi:MFS family permease
MRTVTVAGMYAAAWLACVSGSHVKVFARMLGFNDFAFGLMSAVPFLATAGQLFATVIIERTGLRKYQFIHCASISRLLWLAIVAIPLLLPFPSTWAVAAMLVVLAVIWSSGALAEPAWYSWMGDLIPRRIRGRYLGARSRFMSLVALLAAIVIGVILDRVSVQGAPETYKAQPVLLWVICGILVAAAAFGVTDILLFRRIRELKPTMRDEPPPPVVDVALPPADRRSFLRMSAYRARYLWAIVNELLVDPMKDRVFRHYVSYGATVAFAVSVGGWYFWLNALENLGFSKLGANVLFLAVGSISGLAASRPWGGLIDRWGYKPVLIIATFGTMLSAAPWLLVTRQTGAPEFLISAINWLPQKIAAIFGHGDFLWITPQTPIGAYLAGTVGCLVGGACWTGVSLAQVGVMIGFAGGHGRSKYVAASAVITGVGGVLGGVVGGTLAQLLEPLQRSPIVLGPFLWMNWHACFALSILVRGAGMFWLLGMPAAKAVKIREVVRDMVRDMGVNVYNAITGRLFYPFRIFGWTRRPRGRHNGSSQAR